MYIISSGCSPNLVHLMIRWHSYYLRREFTSAHLAKITPQSAPPPSQPPLPASPLSNVQQDHINQWHLNKNSFFPIEYLKTLTSSLATRSHILTWMLCMHWNERWSCLHWQNQSLYFRPVGLLDILGNWAVHIIYVYCPYSHIHMFPFCML